MATEKHSERNYLKSPRAPRSCFVSPFVLLLSGYDLVLDNNQFRRRSCDHQFHGLDVFNSVEKLFKGGTQQELSALHALVICLCSFSQPRYMCSTLPFVLLIAFDLQNFRGQSHLAHHEFDVFFPCLTGSHKTKQTYETRGLCLPYRPARHHPQTGLQGFHVLLLAPHNHRCGRVHWKSNCLYDDKEGEASSEHLGGVGGQAGLSRRSDHRDLHSSPVQGKRENKRSLSGFDRFSWFTISSRIEFYTGTSLHSVCLPG